MPFNPETSEGLRPKPVLTGESDGPRKVLQLARVETREEWHAACAKFSDAEFTQSYEWGEARRFQGWKPQRFVVTDGSVPLAAAQLILRSWFGLRIVYCPRGPVWLRRGMAPQDCSPFLERVIDAIIEAYPSSVVVFDLHCDRRLVPDSQFLPKGFREIRNGLTADIDLDKDLNVLRSSLHRKWRNDLRKAEQGTLIVHQHQPTKYLDQFYAIADATASRKGFSIGVDYEIAKRFLSMRSPESSVILTAARPDGNVAAAALVVSFNGSASYLVGASVSKDQPQFSRGASNLVQWEALQWAKAKGLAKYNLEGLDPEGNPGVTHFKRRINGRVRLTRGMWVWTKNRFLTLVFKTLLKKRFQP